MKRGQAEMFGLVIIVILLIFALLFFVKVRQDDDSSVTLRSNFRVNNLMNAIMDVDGVNGDLKELMKECIDTRGDSLKCGPVETELKDIFRLTLLEVEKYEFKGYLDENNPIIDLSKDGGCDEGITASPVRLPRGYKFELKLCT